MKTLGYCFSIILIIFCAPEEVESGENQHLTNAYKHLNEVMDQYHRTFDVYTNADAGGNHFYPAIIGNYDEVTVNAECTTNRFSEPYCIKVDYHPSSDDKFPWAAIQWMYPDTNWGYWAGYDITGADSLVFNAKGLNGGEKVEFKLGGVNRRANNDPQLNYQDSFDQLSTGILTLTNQWQQYAINLTDTNYFAVYLDGNSGSNNRYYPSGWYNGDKNMKIDVNCTSVAPVAGESCLKIEWDGFPGDDHWKWNGIVFQYPDTNWGKFDGHDLSGATKLTFWSRTDEPGLRVRFFVGLEDMDSCDEIDKGWVALDTVWQQYTIPLNGEDMSNVRGGFAFVFNDANDPNPDGTVFYLDEIKYDLPLSNDLSNIIGGFICAISKTDNPDGCTLFIDDIQYRLTNEARNERLKQARFLQSYVSTADTMDRYLRNVAYVYDNALALLAYLSRGTEDDLRRAEIIGQAFIYAQEHDMDFKNEYQDFRLRNAYQSGDFIHPHEKYALMPYFWLENLQVIGRNDFDYYTHTGNMAWAMIAMMALYEKIQNKEYLESAERMGNWILEHCYDSREMCGFTGGYEGDGRDKVIWKSIEHNIDIYAAFMKMYEIKPEQKWYDGAIHSARLIANLCEPDSGKYFYLGTKDNDEINKYPLVEDAQTWATLAFADTSPEILSDINWRDVIQWTHDNFSLSCHGFDGIDFNTDRDGIWFEGTAHYVAASYLVGDSINSDQYLEELRKAQTSTNVNSNDKGIVAACHDGVSTGLDWKYYNRLHIGTTAWYIFSEKHWNPYYQKKIIPIENDSGVKEKRGDKVQPYDFKLFPNYPNPFNSNTKIRFLIPKNADVRLDVYACNGQHVKTIIDNFQEKGFHEIVWNGRNENGGEIASSVYFLKLKMENSIDIRKLLLLK